MSRSGYTEDCGDFDYSSFNLWRGTVARAVRGKRGQAFLREMLQQLDAMPEKRLIEEKLIASPIIENSEVVEEGGVCAMGAVGKARGVDMTNLDPEDYDAIAKVFGIAPALVQEIEWQNDDAGLTDETPENRWKRMRAWVESQIAKGKP